MLWFILRFLAVSERKIRNKFPSSVYEEDHPQIIDADLICSTITWDFISKDQ
jgi:hypothetical protein